MRLYSRFAWGVLAYNLLVVAWGAYVRATGSGAGCGGHWPTCHGEIVPPSPTTATLIEYSHRLSSGLALLLTVALVAGAFRVFGKGHPARRGAVLAAAFLVVEALLGASLVLFGLTAKDDSLARGVVMPIHLVNTYLLLGGYCLTAWWASGGADFQARGQGRVGRVLLLGFLGMALLGVSGAVTALGDTLFPAASLAQGLQQDLSPSAHFFLRLRMLHPGIAVVVGLYLAVAAVITALGRPTRLVRIFAELLVGLFFLQLVVGVVNLILLAPVPMQLVHLLCADLAWLALVLLAAAAFAAPPVPAPTA